MCPEMGLRSVFIESNGEGEKKGKKNDDKLNKRRSPEMNTREKRQRDKGTNFRFL